MSLRSGLPDRGDPTGRQFRRAFGTARKKELYTIVEAGEDLGASGVGEAIDVLQPNRLINSWRAVEDESVLTQVVGSSIPMVVSLTRLIKAGTMSNAHAAPLSRLLDNKVDVALSCGLPSLYQSTLIDEYVQAHEECGVPIESVILLARRSIELTRLDADRKEKLLRSFDFELKTARSRFLDRS